MEVTAPSTPPSPLPQEKLSPPFSAVSLRKIQNHETSTLPGSPLKDFKLPLSSWSVSVQHSILNPQETHIKPHI